MQPNPPPKLRLIATSGARELFEDRELVRACLAHELGAGDALWHKHGPMVFRLLGRALGPSGDVEDVAQDVFVNVFSKLGTLRDPDALQSFVYSVAVRVLKWEFRKRRARKLLQLWGDAKLPEVEVAATDTDARVALEHLYRVLDRMSAEERLIFSLRHLEGMKLQEIANGLGISLATTKRKLQRAGARVSAAVESDPALSSYGTKERAP
jgi:RNA polymerase sigma-70 factor (ECF subfamily)